MKIVLIGPPASGKSSVGRRLAALMQTSFVDSDAKISDIEGRTVSEIFVDSGEEYFREIESKVVLDLLEASSGVISLGGGSILDQNVCAKIRELKEENLIVFLDVSLNQASSRIGLNRDRPLLLNNPRAQWMQLMERRRPIYDSLASCTFLTDNMKPNEVAEQILERIKHD
jgi:shikimate kinase